MTPKTLHYAEIGQAGWVVYEWNAPVWQQPLELFDAMITGGVRAPGPALRHRRIHLNNGTSDQRTVTP